MRLDAACVCVAMCNYVVRVPQAMNNIADQRKTAAQRKRLNETIIDSVLMIFQCFSQEENVRVFWVHWASSAAVQYES